MPQPSNSASHQQFTRDTPEAKPEFRVLAFTDTHYMNFRAGHHPKYNPPAGTCDPYMLAFMRASIAHTKPHLVVFNGDVLSNDGRHGIVWSEAVGENGYSHGIEEVLEPVKEAGVPFVIVFGNHDMGDMLQSLKEPGAPLESRTKLMELYLQAGGPHIVNRAAMADGRQHTDASGGVTNLYCPIWSADGSKICNNLYFFDNDINQYEGIETHQLDWYRTVSDQLKAQNGGAPVPSFVFQHVPFPEIFEYLRPARKKREPKTREFLGKDFWWKPPFPNFLHIHGVMMEIPCPGRTTGQLQAHLEQGDVRGIAFGHDHVNQFTVNAKGIKVEQMGSAALAGGYGTYCTRGANLFTFAEDGSYKRRSYSYLQMKRRVPHSGITRLWRLFFYDLKRVPLFVWQNLWQALLTPARLLRKWK
ncbi:MAG: metallophosphoesterase [Oscillospiraceae bacterium]|jgi:predicted phosphodiesterase|nr:metallophosphoesterase [Oscillospiraceae bacterium]